jgi:magnesium-transporting ATPase (P-type)
VRNTVGIIGLVVFTGADTKIMLNGGETPSKRSKIEKETNFNVIVNFSFFTIMCLIAAIFNGVENSKTDTSAQYLKPIQIQRIPTLSIRSLPLCMCFLICPSFDSKSTLLGPV